MATLSRVMAAMVTLTKRYPVDIEQLLEIQRRRAAFRSGRFYRRRARRRVLAKNGGRPQRKKRQVKGPVQYAGEGELHALLREAGMSVQQFCTLAGINVKTFHSWEGHPIALWPVQLLYFVIWAKNMAAVLHPTADKYRPKGAPPAPGGRYPRTREQVEKLIKDAEATVRGP